MGSKGKVEVTRMVMAIAALLFLCGAAVAEDYVWIESGVHDVNETIGGYLIVSDATVNLLKDAHITVISGDGDLYCLQNANVNIYGGAIDGIAYVVADANVTIFGNGFAVDGNDLDPEATEVVNTDPVDPLDVQLSGTYVNGTAFSIHFNLDPGGAKVKLDWGTPPVEPEPDIEVYPADLSYDFGDTPIGEPNTYVVQIGNVGDANLTVTSVGLDPNGSSDFVISSAPSTPFVVAPSETFVVDIEVTFTPTSENLVSTDLIIESDDADEGIVSVELMGAGIPVEIPPAQQMQAIIDFFEESLDNGTLVPYGPGNVPQVRVAALRAMLRSAGRMIEREHPLLAIVILNGVDRRTDGENRPPDFVTGEATATLNSMVLELIEDLTP